jgi:L-galactose dehydrogenase
MKYRKLGRTDLELSVLGFGSSPFGNVFGNTSFEDNQRAVDHAIDQGINFFDVSPYYGLTLAEERLGRTLEGKRKQIVLATKCGRYGVSEFDFSRKRIRAGVDESLRRLKTDHVDLLLAHDIEFGSTEQIVEEAIPAMRELQAQGKARFIGITGYPVELLRRLAETERVDAVLSYCRYTLMNTDMDTVLTPLAEERGVGLINASPLMMGVLTNGGPPSWHQASVEIKLAGCRAADTAASLGVNIATLALQFSLAFPGVASTLVGMASVNEVQRNLLAAQTPLDMEMVQAVQAAIGNGFETTWKSGESQSEG